MKKQSKEQARCPIFYGMEMFGDKWTLLIIRDMIFLGKRSYNEFLTSAESISTNILAERLKRLEENTIITKSKDEHNGTKYIYRLTPKGKDLIPTLFAIMEWAVRYDDKTKLPANLIKNIEENPQQVQRDILLAMQADKSYFTYIQDKK